MAQQGAGRPRLFLDQARNQYFYHDERTDEYVYQDGSRTTVPRPSATPRTTDKLREGQQNPSSHYSYSGSPPRDPNYAHDQHGQHRLGGPEAQANVASLESEMRSMTIGPPSSRTYDRGGIQIVEAQNPQSLVKTRFGTSPANRITDPTLYNAGVRAHRMLYGTGGGEVEQLYSNYRTRKHDFFCFGRVFLILWVEPAGESGSVVTNMEQSDQAISVGAFNERVFSKVRRFVVIREGENYCSALPIATYGQRGVSKPGVKKSEHAIIYSCRDAPQPRVHEQPQRGEAGMRPIPIRVVPDDPTEALDPMSRLDFGKVHTIQHNIKVRPFGNVHPNSRDVLYTQFTNAWSNTATPIPSSAGLQTDQPRTTASSSAVRHRRPRSVTSGGSDGRRYTTSTEPVAEESEGSDEDAGEEDEGEEEDEDEHEDEGEGEGDALSSPSSYRGRGHSSQSRSTHARATPVAQSQNRTKSSSAGSSQAAWTVRVQQARGAVSRLINRGYTKEQAFAELVTQIESQGRTPQAAHTEAQALLTGKLPSE